MRLARREAWRHRGRSVLVVVMIGLPVAAIVFGAVALRTLQLGPEQRVTTSIGTAADAFVARPGDRSFVGTPFPGEIIINSGKRIVGPPATIDDLVPTATRVLPTSFRYGGGRAVPVSAGGRLEFPSIRELDYTDPLAAGLVDQMAGRSPESPDEVVLTESLAETLGAEIGDQVIVKEVPYTVVGTVRLVYGTDWDQVVGDVGAFDHLRFPAISSAPDLAGTGWLVEVPGGLDYAQILEINALGADATSRLVAADLPDPCSTDVPQEIRTCGAALSSFTQQELAETAALVALGVVIGLLQVILLVGPAFAIGRRSQTRDLALLSAVGGDAKAVRRVVLSSGLVLGLVGGLGGLVVGVVSFQLLRPLTSRLAGTTLFATDLHPEVVLVLVVTTLTGLAAAWLPARAASKQDVVAALAGRRGSVRTRRGMPIAGAIALGVGVAIAFLGTAPGNMTMLLLGAVVAELGLVAMAPWLVGVASRAGSRLPTTPRLALRDAGRNRLRTGTAVAAVLSAVAGAAAMGIWVASDTANAERHHVPLVPEGYVVVAVERGAWPGDDISFVEDALPTEVAVPMSSMDRSSCISQRCAEWKVEQQVDPCVVTSGNGSACGYSFGSPWAPWMFGDETTYRALTGVDPSAGVTTALEDGGVVVGTDYASSYIADGQMTFESRQTGERVLLPAVAAPASDVGAEPRFELLLSDQARQTLSLNARDLGYTVITTRAPTTAELAAARGAVAEITPLGSITAGTAYEANTAVPLLIILGLAVLLAVAATATATGLAAADARPDLATLAAIGAPPRTRRWVSASQAAVISVLGTVLGVVGGVVIGVAAIGATTDNYWGYSSDGPAPPTLPVSIPWGSLGVLAVVVPAVAVTLAFLFSRSSLPMVRRIE